jgi:ArsR family transcriptional regulator, lead/cadmium/zinc/bismuth-responsive transcriptional repressor
MTAGNGVDYIPPIHGISEYHVAHCAHEASRITGIPSTEQLGRAAELFRAMGDPERLRLLTMLQDGERCVGELLGERDKLSTVSARLQALHRARLLHRRREARHIYYRLADGHVASLLNNALEHAAEQLASPLQPIQEDKFDELPDTPGSQS